MPTSKPLNTQLLAAHAAGDLPRLVELYRQAANRSDAAGQQRFFLTQAYILALDCGADGASDLRAQLVAMGAESPVL
jgi:hypothetical protein